jgi:hypothetical protein
MSSEPATKPTVSPHAPSPNCTKNRLHIAFNAHCLPQHSNLLATYKSQPNRPTCLVNAPEPPLLVARRSQLRGKQPLLLHPLPRALTLRQRLPHAHLPALKRLLSNRRKLPHPKDPVCLDKWLALLRK